ncbi:E3 ubiquitin/ISG15 ligase TRIM25-like isoform X1 [Carcharodon carcharias]|uniref:E3 ubiquitin/ISG15 ligase TRIM25-like isoform X1 n=1 Tax=Carcharodon carcharias TaxID=13397 RepID=UPI001B7E4C15|nr:E3 ubiquitin/ISG15 ligase TRIM25-like isoform X1 [Carcharodon carcharias]
MEARALEEVSNCAVCLQVYKDPVTLPCQHSFCLKCIEDVWTQAVDQDGFSCPQCHKKFNPKPNLERGIPTVTCDYCIESPSPAAKTCLKCETSFCALHLKPHLTKEIFNDHVLVDPVTDLNHRKCPDHQKILEFFCTDDEVCVCSSCGVIGRHKSHTMVGLDEREAEMKEELKSEVENLWRLQQNYSIKQQDLEKSEAEIKTLVNELKGSLSKKFSESSKQLEEDEKDVLKLIDQEERRVLSQIWNYSDALNKVMEHITLIENEARDLMQGDSLYSIQNSKELLSRVIEIQEVTYLITPELTLNLSNVSQLLKERTEKSKKYYLAVEELIRMHECMKSTSRNGPADPSRLPRAQNNQASPLLTQRAVIKNCRLIETRSKFSTRPMLARKVVAASPWVGNPKAYVLKRSLRESKAQFPWLTLDPKTANGHLILSDDLRSVMHRYREQPYPRNPMRFETRSQVLCAQNFFWGCHSWDVETSGNWWEIGIAYGSIPKRGCDSDLRKTTKAWCLHFCISTLSAYHNKKFVHLPLKHSASRVRVQLDYDAGTVSFFQVTDTLTHLHTFETTFTGHVYPAFCCEDKSELRLLNSF